MSSHRSHGTPRPPPGLALALLLLAMQLLAAASCTALRMQEADMTLQYTQQPEAPSAPIPGNLPDSIDVDSPHYRRWLKLQRLGWDGGEALRALAAEGGDEHRAHVLLAQRDSGFDGLRCLSKGNCFNDPRRAVFSPPAPLSAPIRPPPMQAPPPPQSEAERQRDEERRKQQAAQLGVDYSAQLLAQTEKRQQFEERAAPTLNPFALASKHTPSDEDIDRSVPLRREMGPSEQQSQFTQLMRNWLTTISSPFHTRKPDSVHESEPLPTVLPADTHPDLVPVPARMRRTVTMGGDARYRLRTEWHAPPHYESHTLQQLQQQREQPRIDAERYARNQQTLRLGPDLKPKQPAAPTPDRKSVV